MPKGTRRSIRALALCLAYAVAVQAVLGFGMPDLFALERGFAFGPVLCRGATPGDAGGLPLGEGEAPCKLMCAVGCSGSPQLDADPVMAIAPPATAAALLAMSDAPMSRLRPRQPNARGPPVAE